MANYRLNKNKKTGFWVGDIKFKIEYLLANYRLKKTGFLGRRKI